MGYADMAVGDVILAGEHGQYTGARAGGRAVDCDDPRMGMGCAHEYRARLPGESLVVGIAPGAANEPQVLKARYRPADLAVAQAAGVCDRVIHCCHRGVFFSLVCYRCRAHERSRLRPKASAASLTLARFSGDGRHARTALN